MSVMNEPRKLNPHPVGSIFDRPSAWRMLNAARKRRRDLQQKYVDDRALLDAEIAILEVKARE